MSLRLLLPAFVVLAAPALAQNFSSLPALAEAGELDFRKARMKLPRLTEVEFARVDANGDGLVDTAELPVLEGMYRSLYMGN